MELLEKSLLRCGVEVPRSSSFSDPPPPFPIVRCLLQDACEGCSTTTVVGLVMALGMSVTAVPATDTGRLAAAVDCLVRLWAYDGSAAGHGVGAGPSLGVAADAGWRWSVPWVRAPHPPHTHTHTRPVDVWHTSTPVPTCLASVPPPPCHP